MKINGLNKHPMICFIGVRSELFRFIQLNGGIDWTHITGPEFLCGMSEWTIIVGDSGRRLLYENPKFGDAVNRAMQRNAVIYL